MPAKKTTSREKAFRRTNRDKSHKKGANPRWVRGVKTVSTFPPEGLFTKDPETIAKTMASKKVSPKGLGSGIKMIQYFINRGGKGLSAARKRKLEQAKKILQEKRDRQRHHAR